MAKIKRYAGLLAAIALLVLGFLPEPSNTLVKDNSDQISRLDNTLLSALIMHKSEPRDYDKRSYWKTASQYFNTCPPFQASDSKAGFRDNCDGSHWVFVRGAMENMRELQALEANYPEMAEQYQAILRTENNLLSTKRRKLDVDPSLLAKALEPRYQLELKMGAAISKFLKAERLGIALTIYFLHAAWIVVFLLLAWQRAMVGGLICLPFGLLFGAGKEVANAAKKAHEKV